MNILTMARRKQRQPKVSRPRKSRKRRHMDPNSKGVLVKGHVRSQLAVLKSSGRRGLKVGGAKCVYLFKNVCIFLKMCVSFKSVYHKMCIFNMGGMGNRKCILCFGCVCVFSTSINGAEPIRGSRRTKRPCGRVGLIMKWMI